MEKEKFYDEIFRKGLWINIGPATYARYLYIKKLFKFNKNDILLDVGCGSGRFMFLLAEYVNHCYGIDVSSEALKTGRTLFKFKNARFEKGDVTKLPFKDNSFDKIICIDVLEHIEDDVGVLKEINRTLKQNGEAVIFFVDNVASNKFTRKLIGKEDAGHIRAYHKSDIIEKLQKTNFKVEELISYKTLFDHLLNLIRERRKKFTTTMTSRKTKFDRFYKLISYFTYIEKYFWFIPESGYMCKVKKL